jgi:RsiW-degrading membrane proteinase PrsW (M82 family)
MTNVITRHLNANDLQKQPFIEKYPFILAFSLGLLPAVFWLWFWLKEDRHPESAKMITLSFVGGMLAVVLVLPFQQFVGNYISGENQRSLPLRKREEVQKVPWKMIYNSVSTNTTKRNDTR